MQYSEAVTKIDKKLPLGTLLMQAGLITQEQLSQALAVQKQQSAYMPLGDTCVMLKFILRSDLQNILKKYHNRILLGELLVNLGLVTPGQIAETLAQQKHDRRKIGRILIEKGLISEEAFVNALSMQLGIPKIDANIGLLDKSLLQRLSEHFLRKNIVLPAFKTDDVLTLIMADPLNEAVLGDLQALFGCKIEPAVAPAQAILDVITKCFQKPDKKVKTLEGIAKKDLVIGQTQSGDESADNTVDLVNYIIGNAISDGASDIHIEPQETFLRIRYRIDGMLYHKTDLPKSLALGLASRIKILCHLDIAERRRHQDGRIQARVMDQDVDLRVSTYAAIYGESIVIRILQRQTSLMDIEELGLSPVNDRRYRQLLGYPSGIIMVTGPTGSGKTTTLYASINHLTKLSMKIITVEDPVEYTMGGVIQGQMDSRLGLSYSDFLKSMMRQDPDVLMLGEMRDREAAEAVIQCALTGHKILTTFHTDDTTGALLRMMDMGIDTFLISSTVVSVISQRLIRKLCVHCRQPARPVPGVLRSFHIREEGAEHFTFHEAKGCAQCKGTGFKGRTAIHELLVVNDVVRDAILARKTSSQIRLIARAEAHLISLREDGFYRATQGVTTLEEVARVVFHNESDELAPRSGNGIVALCEGKMLEEILPAELPCLDSVSGGRPMAPIFASMGEDTLFDGEAYRIRFDCHTIAGEEDRIADFFDAYQALLLKLKKPIDSGLSEEFAAFIIETVEYLSTCEGAEYAEFSLQVQKEKVIIRVETQLPPKRGQMPLASRESGLGRLNYLR